MESGKMHAFDNTDTNIIEIVKENIISVLSTVAYQETIENIVRVDKFTGLYSAEYLYGKGKLTFNKFATSAVCMFQVTNIQDINEKQSREIGNEVITEVSNLVKSQIPSQYIFVRYMGPKFVLVFSGVEERSVEEFLKTLKQELEEIEIVQEAEEVQVVKVINGKRVRVRELIEEKSASPKVSFVVSTYYKGTGIEQLTKKLEEFIDSDEINEDQINYI